MGTVTELSLVWNKIQDCGYRAASARLVGRLLAANRARSGKTSGYSHEDVSALDFAQTPEEAVGIISEKSKE